MKTLVAVVVMSAVASLSLAPAVQAQDRPQTPSRSSTEKMREAFKAPAGVVDTSTLIRTKVRDSAGKDLGEIDQLLVDTKAGKITHAVIGKGGVLGVGETKVVVPWADVQLKADANNRDKLLATIEQSTLDAAPRYDRRAAATDRPVPAPAASPKMEEKRPEPSK